MVQIIPHSQPHAIGARDLQMFGPSQALLDVLCWNWQPNQESNFLLLSMLQPGRTHPTLSWWTQTYSFPAKVAICCKRVFGCYFLLGYVEEELGGMWSYPKQNSCGEKCFSHRHSSVGPFSDILDHRAQPWNWPQAAYSAQQCPGQLVHIHTQSPPLHIWRCKLSLIE